MVFVYVPPPDRNRKSTPRETLTGLLIAGVITLAFSGGIIFLKASKTGSRPPLLIIGVIAGLAVIVGFIAFFSWLHQQGQGDRAESDNNSREEQ